MRKKVFNFIFGFILSILLFNKVSAQTYKMPLDSYTKFEKKYFDINKNHITESNIEITNSNIELIKKDNEYVLTFNVGEAKGSEAEYKADETSSKPYLVKLTFDNVGVINNRKVDTIVYVKRVSSKDDWWTGSSNNAAKPVFLTIKNNKLELGSNSSSPEYKRFANQEVDIDVKMIWHDNKSVIDLPFYSVQSDIDVENQEAWQPLTGYSNDFFVYEGSMLEGSATTGLKVDSDNKWSFKGTDVNDDESYTKAGVYATTNNGEFKSRYYEGNSGTTLLISSQLMVNYDSLVPSKNVKITSSDNIFQTKVNTVGDKVEYTIKQKFGNKFENVFTVYKDVVIKDVIPEGLEFVSAQMSMSNNDITTNTSYGTLNYDQNLKLLTYTFNNTWLQNLDNYNGQEFVLKINTKVVEIKEKYTNKATTTLYNSDVPSNQVETISNLKKIIYKYVSTSDKVLPSEISVDEGSFKINDNKTYYNGQTVERLNDVKPGVTYTEYDSEGNKKGVWKLVGWDNDSLTVSDDEKDYTFTAYWEYTDTTKPSISNPNTRDAIILFILVGAIAAGAFLTYTKKFVREG